MARLGRHCSPCIHGPLVCSSPAAYLSGTQAARPACSLTSPPGNRQGHSAGLAISVEYRPSFHSDSLGFAYQQLGLHDFHSWIGNTACDVRLHSTPAPASTPRPLASSYARWATGKYVKLDVVWSCVWAPLTGCTCILLALLSSCPLEES